MPFVSSNVSIAPRVTWTGAISTTALRFMTTLASFALLKTRFDFEKKDFLDSLRPFVAYIVTKENIESVTALTCQKGLVAHFGLTVPQHTVELLLRRMAKDEQFEKQDKSYKRKLLDFDLVEFEKHRTDAIRHQAATEASLIRYAREELELILTKEDAENALNDYIDQYSIECIEAYSKGSIVSVHGRSNKHWPFIVSSFVSSISEADPEGFSYFVTVVMGRMLSNALLGSDLGSINMRFNRTCVYLDTPIVLQLIGVLGDAAEKLAEEMLVLLRKFGAQVAVFDHVVDETDQVLSNTQRHLENGTVGKGDVVSSLRELRKTASDVVVLRSSMTSMLAGRNISVASTPAYDHDLQIDEKLLEQEMKNSGLFYKADLAKRVDINSIRSIYVLRRENAARRVEDCGAILVTNNHALARAAYAYGKDHQSSRELSTIITDFSLTNLLWLKSPVEYSDIPRRMVTANCFAALHPSEEFWSVFLSQLEKLQQIGKITAEQHRFIRYELRVRRDLMNLTLGDEANLTERQILQAIDRYEHALTKPLYDKVEQLQQQLRDSSDRHEVMSAIVNKIDNRVKAVARNSRRVVSTLLVLFAVAFVAYAHGWIGPAITNIIGEPWLTILRIGSYLVDVFIVLHLFVHVEMWNPIRTLANFVERKVTELLLWALGINTKPLPEKAPAEGRG